MNFAQNSVSSPLTSTPRIRFDTVRLPAKISHRISRIGNKRHRLHRPASAVGGAYFHTGYHYSIVCKAFQGFVPFFQKSKKEERRVKGVQLRDATAAKRILSRRAALKILGIHIQYSCTFRLARHKTPSFCGAEQFCERHFSFRQYRKLRKYLMYFRSFLCRMGGKGPRKTCRLPKLRALLSGAEEKDSVLDPLT